MAKAPIEVDALTGVSDVTAEVWDGLVGPAPPVLEHAFLSALESTDCVGPTSGWIPTPIVATTGTEQAVVGAAPAYLKAHSMGEFVYDWAWADAAQRAGLRYYPKLVVASPFSPVAGPRLLTAPGLSSAQVEEVAGALLSAAEQRALDAGCSGVHVLFCTQEEARFAAERGYTIRTGLQFHWHNDTYDDFASFAGRFRAKRRNQIRRERRRVHEAGVSTVSLSGDAIELRHMEDAFRFYAATVDMYSWGRRYLNEALFRALWTHQRDRLQLMLATDDDSGRIVGGTFNFQKGQARYGRYWGCDAHIPMLHFEVCSYAPIEDCIGEGIEIFEAGAGGGHHKYRRGFLPVLTFSAHKLFHPRFHQVIADYCASEGAAVRAEAAALRDALFVR